VKSHIIVGVNRFQKLFESLMNHAIAHAFFAMHFRTTLAARDQKTIDVEKNSRERERARKKERETARTREMTQETEREVKYLQKIA